MSDNGRNPLRWKCDKDGCFNEEKRPKIEEFAECLPGKIAFSDIDAITEINGKFLLLEWKSYAGSIPLGQKIMFERMTDNGKFSVFIIKGNAKTMKVDSMSVVWKGKVGNFNETNLEGLKERISKWAEWAKAAATK